MIHGMSHYRGMAWSQEDHWGENSNKGKTNDWGEYIEVVCPINLSESFNN